MRRLLSVCVVLLLAFGAVPVGVSGQGEPGGEHGSELNQNEPSVDPTTTIAFEIVEEDVRRGAPAVVTLRIFNVLQQLVAVPKAMNHPLGEVPVENLEYREPGHYETLWDGTDLNGRKVALGIYYYQLVVNGERRVVRKMVIAK